MPRFFIEPLAPGEEPLLTGEDALHVAKALRMRQGDSLTLCDGEGLDYHCEILGIESDTVQLRLLGCCASEGEPSVAIHLYQALPKGEKLEFIVQKAVELGAATITPVLTLRCISRPDEKSMQKKCLRLQKIALEAAKQSGRGRVPKVQPLLSFPAALSDMKSVGRPILLYERAQTPLSRFLSREPVSFALMVGAEGGFSEEEARLAGEMGVGLASLGTRILRCETAPVCALSALLYASGEL